MIDLKKTKMMIREMKADHIFSKSEATQLSIIADCVKDGRDGLAIMLALILSIEITKKGLALQDFVSLLRGAKEQA